MAWFRSCPSKLPELARSFDIGAWGAKGDGVTDDTAAINAALRGGGTWVFPRGRYLCNTVTHTFGGISYALHLTRSDTRLVFEPGAELVTTGDLSILGMGGALSSGGSGFSQRWIGDPDNATYHPVQDVERAATTLTLTSQDDAANFAAGDYVHLRTGSLHAGQDTEPLAEINQIVAVSGATLTLRWPTSNAYEQEWFISGTTGKTSTTDTGNPAVFGVANITDRTIENISIEGLTLDTLSTTRSAIVVRGGVVGLSLEGLAGQVGGSPVDAIEYRGGQFRDWDLHMHAPSSGTARWLISGATSVTDSIWERIRGVATGPRMMYAHLHEGCSGLTVRDMRIVTVAGNNDSTPLSIRARATDVRLEDIDIISSGTQSAYVDDTCTDVAVVRPRVEIRGTTGKGLRILGATNRVLDAHPSTIVATI